MVVGLFDREGKGIQECRAVQCTVCVSIASDVLESADTGGDMWKSSSPLLFCAVYWLATDVLILDFGFFCVVFCCVLCISVVSRQLLVCAAPPSLVSTTMPANYGDYSNDEYLKIY